jgi:hypothetical protein
MVAVNESSGNYYAAGGEFVDGWVKNSIRNFGNYAIVADTIPPKITPLSIEEKKTLKESTRIRFKISDDLSGISEIKGFLDGKWALFEYDAKNNLITHYFDAERFELKKQHQLKLLISDYKNNTSIYEANFWK